ncbi:MAG: sirohydrochlorin chelatase [Betaproteobacteria bacterium]|jgi:sirohydrochlorin cobaltochelatase
MNGWILFAHGSSDPDWAQPLRAIEQRLVSRHGRQVIALAFLERQSPGLDQAAAQLVDAGVSHITIIPMFLGMGGHLKRDLPELIAALRERWKTVEFQLAPAIGESRNLIEAIADWISGDIVQPRS